MTRPISHEDNLFFLKMVLKQLSAYGSLQVDGSLFAEKVHQDILFVERTLTGLLAVLADSSHLINRAEYLKDLYLMEREYCRFLEETLQTGLLLGATVELSPDQVKGFLASHAAEAARIKEVLSELQSQKSGRDAIVSEEEFKFLLTPNPEESGEP